MSVFLLILKIAGIVLLSLISFVLLLVLLVLFVPIRYKGKGFYCNKEYDFKANASWLLHIISCSYNLKKEDSLCIRVFGFRINKSNDKNADIAVKEDDDYISYNSADSFGETEALNKEDKDDKEGSSFGNSTNDVCTINVFTSNNTANNDTILTAEETDEDTSVDDNNKNEKKKKKEKKSSKEKKKEKSKNKKVKQKSTFYDKIKQYYEIVQTKEFEKGFEYSKKKIARLLKIILPRKWKVYGTVGFEDPATTGKIYEFMGIFYSVFENHLFIDGDFDNSIIDIKGDFKGRITIFRLLIVGAAVYFNKNLRLLYKKFKEVK